MDPTGQPKSLELLPDKTKTGEPRVIPVGGRLRAVLDMRRSALEAILGDEMAPAARAEAVRVAYVFGNEVGEPIQSVKTAWRKTLRRAGVAGLHLHDLRREFASQLLESKAELHDVQAFLGHANITTTSRYLRSTPLRLEQALARLEQSDAPPPTEEPAAEAPAAPPTIN